MPKNKGQNAFYFFMLDWKKRQESQGRTFPNGLRDVQCDRQCSAEWQSLTPQQKGHYNAKAKNSKVLAQGSMNKKTALGENLDEIIANEIKEQEFQQNMLQYIESIISMGIDHNSFKKLKFIFIHVNWFFTRELGINTYDYYPAEFAVGEFSLENGIENVYHEIINEKIPLGYRSNAIETSQQTHRIPVELKDGQSDFSYMYNKVIELLKPNMTGNRYPPLFTTKDVTPAVHSLLNRMTRAADLDKDKFLVYSLEALFASLRNTAAQNVDHCSIPLVVAENEFSKDVFSSVFGLECDFHRIMDGTSQYCSMSIVKRWGYTICDYCCAFLDIQMIDGVHRPHSTSISNNTNQDDLDVRLKNLNFAEQTVSSMSGVTEEYRIKVSERTYKDEQKRRNLCKPLEIIDHSKLNIPQTLNNPVIPGRPLRLPKTKSQAQIELEEKNAPFKASDFPPIGGRGIIHKKRTMDAKLPLGRGRGSC